VRGLRFHDVPRISRRVIVLVERQEKVLLARASRFENL
jgi:NADH pyrophosphatase NudC (nudix superfamily)